jgi:hypothetical protein
MAKKEIAASGGTQGGEGMATAGMVLGIISIVLTIIVTIVYVIYFAAAIGHSGGSVNIYGTP